jgi:transcriptional regulator with XRE-family HTH domain
MSPEPRGGSCGLDHPARFLGGLIAERRRVFGLSQRSLADVLCARTGRPTLTRNEISRYERETRIPTTATLAALTDVLGVPAPVLVQATGLTRRRRYLAGVTDAPVLPGYLIGASGHALVQPMVLVGVDPDDWLPSQGQVASRSTSVLGSCGDHWSCRVITSP